MTEIDEQIAAKEQMLQHVIEFVHGANTIKAEYERLISHIQSLESEHEELNARLEQERAQQATSKSSSLDNTAAVGKLKERYAMSNTFFRFTVHKPCMTYYSFASLREVTEQLQEMRQERKKKEESYRLYQQEARKSQSLQAEIAHLKDSRATLLRQQRGAAAEFKKYKQDKVCADWFDMINFDIRRHLIEHSGGDFS